jgi:hypothetical protein
MVMLSILVIASQSKAQTTILTEGWESTTVGSQVPPAGWAYDVIAGSSATFFESAGTWPTCSPYEGSRFVEFQSFNYSSATNRLRRTVPANTLGWTNLSVDLAWYLDNGYSSDLGEGVTVQWSTNGTTWNNSSFFQRYDPTNQWVIRTATLPAGASAATLYIAFSFLSQYGDNCHMDIIHLKGTPPPSGNLTGTVTNCLSSAPIPNASVTCGNIGPVLTNASGVYLLNGVYAGVEPITATAVGYSPYSASATVVANVTTTFNFCMNPLPGQITGIVTNASNGNPVVGAHIFWGAYSTYSTAGGAYTLTAYAAGTNPLTASKPGFNNISLPGIVVTVPAPPATVQNIALMEDTPPPSSPFIAALNTGQTAVNLNWGLPVDDMVLIYDDGIQDNFAIWGTGGGHNMNAMKFTPISYPTTVKQFMINIGTAANYATGSNPFSPVQIDIYNEVAGLPGTSVSTQSITPTAYGWTGYITFATPLTLTSGNFYIVMTQQGTSLLSPGIAIDTTANQLRSYSKFGTTGTWLPGPGNFMMRAVVNGSGGPLMMSPESGKTITASAIPGLIYQYKPGTVTGTEGSPKVYPEMGYNPENLIGYQIWRLTQGQEGTPALWTSVGTPTTTTFVDNSYPSLPCGGYRWAAEAQYTFNRWSTAIFSTAVGKCWTCTVTINVAVSCDSTTALGSAVTFTNLDVVGTPDTVYTFIMPATGTYVKTNFWKGHYNLTINKLGYTIYSSTNLSIFGDMTINATLLQFKTPPTNLAIHDTDALATWDPPVLSVPYFVETFSTGFGTNGWVPDAGSNWGISTVNGNPGSCAEWNAVPEQTGYSQSLTSATMTGRYSAFLKLQYDIQLSAVGNTTLEEMAVEVWNGSSWYLVKNYDNSSGNSMPYTSESFDITSHAPNTGFKVRFRAHGVDSQWINYWDIDNVKLVAQTDPRDPCIVGYNFTLNGATIGFTRDTFFHIPAAQLVYGTSYVGCVYAIYGSGYSTQICLPFVDHFLCPPTGLTGVGIECNAYLTWIKPNCGGCTLTSYVFDNGTAGDGYSYGVGSTCLIGNFFNISTTAAGVIKSFDMYFASTAGSTTAQNCVLYVYDATHTNILGQSAPFLNTGAAWPSGTWVNVPVTDIPYTGPFYAMVDYTITSSPDKNWYCVDVTTIQPGFPDGLGFADIGGTWSSAASAWGYLDPRATFLQRANVCANDKKDGPITTNDPSTMPKAGARSSAAVNIGSSSDIPAGDPRLSPEAPLANPVLLGYTIYRNGVRIQPNTGTPNTLYYYDYNLNPGTYKYAVAGYYNTTPIPPLHAESRADGPVTFPVVCGYPLPFYEPWSAATGFAYQNWTFSPNQSNWSFNTAIGDPAPCADFSWSPIITNYNSSLITPVINASPYSCAKIYCDFDLKLIDRNNTGTEKISVDILVGGVWTNKAVISDSGSFDWTLKHIDITAVMGKAFQLRFNANGASSGNILHWYVDNINIYAVCIAPTGLQGLQTQFTTHLTWHTPKCPASCGLKTYTFDSGTAGDGYSYGVGSTCLIGNYFPINAGASGVIKSVDMYFSSTAGSTTAQPCTITFYKADQTTILGTSPTFTNTGDAWPSGTWVNVPVTDIPYTGPFYAMVDYTITAAPDKNWFCVDITTVQPGYTDGLGFANIGGTWSSAASAWGYLDPMATFLQRVHVCENGAKDKDAPITIIDPTSLPTFKNLPRQAAALSAGTIKGNTATTYAPPASPEAPAGSLFKGYNIYRTDDGNITGPFHKVNTTFWADTVYADVHPSTTNATSWKYYVTALFQDSLNLGVTLCESPSDTITMIFPALGIADPTNGSISLYPNPANDLVNIVSTNDIKTIEVLDYIGQTIYKANDVNLKATKLEVSTFTAGVYFVKITTSNGIKTSKITVTH